LAQERSEKEVEKYARNNYICQVAKSTNLPQLLAQELGANDP
jgi:hypothetical protein